MTRKIFLVLMLCPFEHIVWRKNQNGLKEKHTHTHVFSLSTPPPPQSRIFKLFLFFFFFLAVTGYIWIFRIFCGFIYIYKIFIKVLKELREPWDNFWRTILFLSVKKWVFRGGVSEEIQVSKPPHPEHVLYPRLDVNGNPSFIGCPFGTGLHL